MKKGEREAEPGVTDEPGGDYAGRVDAESGGDFADEHSDATLAGEMEGGPEGEDEDDSPSGLARAD